MYRFLPIALGFLWMTPVNATTTTITFDESQSTMTGFNGQSNQYLTSSDGEYTVEFFWLNNNGHDHVSGGVEYNHNQTYGAGGSLAQLQGVRIVRVDGDTFNLTSMGLYGDAAVGQLSSTSSGSGSWTLYQQTSSGSTSSPPTYSFGSTYANVSEIYIVDGYAGSSSSTNTSSGWDDIVLEQNNDVDGDGYTDDVDCDDNNSSVNPGATEYCDGIDNNCDGTIDEDSAADASTFYADSDSDGFGDPASGYTTCYQPSGQVSDNTDCDDTNSSTYPGADEYCDGHDDDCDGDVDESDALDVSTWYADTDADGYGDPSSITVSCYAATGYVADATDCDDADSATYPNADEYCDGHDDDCDGDIDEDESVDVSTWYADADGDGEGDTAVSDIDCYQPTGYVSGSTDCDDTSAVLNTSDSDADGYTSCDSDCDDTDAAINVDAEETWYDGIDQDCDGWSDFDQDGDGFDHLDYDGDDCDDENPDINVDAEEIWYDGIDQDCDTLSDFDADYDGQDSESYGGDDCDDADPDTYDGAPDTPYDGIITDCSNANDYDADGDGALALDYGGQDCDDANSEAYPGAEEIWYDGIDQDCDGNDDDQDEDGYALDADCDDEDPDSYPDNGSLDADCNPIETEDTGLDTGDSADKAGGCSSTPAPTGVWGLLLAGLLIARRRTRSVV